MSSSTDPKTGKKRVGRKRLPPLAQGPPLQFVVASHPDDFKAGQTMRHIRSHVMYKHRGDQRTGSKSPTPRSHSRERRRHQAPNTRSPSPTMRTHSEGLPDDHLYLAPPSRRRSNLWDGEGYTHMSQSPAREPSRNLVARIIAATTAEPARSAPPMTHQGSEYPFPHSGSMGQESLEDLKRMYFDHTGFQQDRSWMEIVCSTRMSFLSHVSAGCVYQDVADGRLDDSSLTVYARDKLMRMIKDSPQSYNAQTDDFTLLSILHLLISEIGGFDQDAFSMHQQALVNIVHQRGGLGGLGVNGRTATFLIVVILAFTVLRGHPEPAILHGFTPSRRQSITYGRGLPISPLFAPHGNLEQIYGSCSDDTYHILHDMFDLTQTFMMRWNYVRDVYSSSSGSEISSYDARMQQIYARLLLMRPSTEGRMAPDWTYESVRLAAHIYCRSIVTGVPFSDSGSVPNARSSGSGHSSGITIISALHHAVDNTDKNDSWGNLSGVFLWVSLVGGAASWPCLSQPIYGGMDDGSSTASAWTRKCFSLDAVKSSLGCGFEHAGAVVETQRAMLQVQNLIDLKRGISPQ